jgi:para-nitrobenzyl esterase
MQGPGMVDWYAKVAAAFGYGPEVVGKPISVSEDCLYLNIWSPGLQADTGLPVMVFVHGGSNSGGWSYEPNYLGARLAQRGVVVVTISYRLGVFGFFSHPALENSVNEPVANFGLLDIRQAFGWISKHIHAFGGDPHNITAFGESAGALNIVDLMLSEAASGQTEAPLFRRLISQSLGGSLDSRQTLVEEQAVGEKLVSLLGLDKEITAQGLRDIPADRLLAATGKLPPDHYHDGVIDGRILTKQPMELLNRVQLSGVDIIAGSNADEWLMYIDEDSSADQLESWVAENAPGYRQALLEMVVDQVDRRKALDRLSTGKDMLCPSRYLAAKISAGGGRGWIYYFKRQRPGPGGDRLGAYHGAELPYVFNTHDEWLPTAAADRELTAAMMDYWVQFARSGDPNAAGRPRWPLHELSSQAVLTLGEQIALRQSDDRVLCELLGPPRLPNEMEHE